MKAQRKGEEDNSTNLGIALRATLTFHFGRMTSVLIATVERKQKLKRPYVWCRGRKPSVIVISLDD